MRANPPPGKTTDGCARTWISSELKVLKVLYATKPGEAQRLAFLTSVAVGRI